MSSKTAPHVSLPWNSSCSRAYGTSTTRRMIHLFSKANCFTSSTAPIVSAYRRITNCTCGRGKTIRMAHSSIGTLGFPAKGNNGMSSLAECIEQASRSFTGQLLQPADSGYDDWRRVHNGLIDKRPAAIARCRGVADIVDAVRSEEHTSELQSQS